MRYDMPKAEVYYCSDAMIRTIEEMKKVHRKKTGHFDSVNLHSSKSTFPM